MNVRHDADRENDVGARKGTRPIARLSIWSIFDINIEYQLGGYSIFNIQYQSDVYSLFRCENLPE